MAEAGVVLNGLPRKLGRVMDSIPAWVFTRPVQLLLDGILAALAGFLAYILRFDGDLQAAKASNLILWIAVVAVVQPMTLLLSKGYDATWRFFNIRDAIRFCRLTLPVSFLLVILRMFAPYSSGLKAMPYSVVVLQFGVFAILAVGVRLTRRIMHQALRSTARSVPTLIVGNGSALASAVQHVQLYSDVKVVGLVSENEEMQGFRVGGIPVLGYPQALTKLIASLGAELVIVAGTDLHCIGDVVEKGAQFGVQVSILPSARDLVDGSVRVSRTVQIAEVAPKRRASSGQMHPRVVDCLRGRNVLITGAGGSIGSEIARQVSQLPINKLIILDRDENSIFELGNQLKDVETEVVPLVGDIREKALLQLAFASYRPHAVLHAAAYKHVPVMESNCCEAVLNNVLGTRQLVDAAVEYGCERFVMISTDKAVRPTSVMGATKRLAELLVQMRARSSSHPTSFACVRFGNVLGSRGSVVPIFLRQIAAGGPVTITSEEMTRYFMSIPQAVQLVLQAATLASSGDVYMLDMGDPVKIVDFAKELIQLSGLRPGEDIKIKVVGTRPGEKLHEQLWLEDANVTATEFPYVFRVKALPTLAHFERDLVELEQLAMTRTSNTRIKEFLSELPISYRKEAPLQVAAATN